MLMHHVMTRHGVSAPNLDVDRGGAAAGARFAAVAAASAMARCARATTSNAVSARATPTARRRGSPLGSAKHLGSVRATHAHAFLLALARPLGSVRATRARGFWPPTADGARGDSEQAGERSNNHRDVLSASLRERGAEHERGSDADRERDREPGEVDRDDKQQVREVERRARAQRRGAAAKAKAPRS